MLKWTKDKFRQATEFFLWLNLVVCVIGGAMLGHLFEKDAKIASGMVIGFFLGAFVGLTTNIIYGGFTAIFLNMDENLEKIQNNLNSFVAKAAKYNSLEK